MIEARPPTPPQNAVALTVGDVPAIGCDVSTLPRAGSRQPVPTALMASWVAASDAVVLVMRIARTQEL